MGAASEVRCVYAGSALTPQDRLCVCEMHGGCVAWDYGHGGCTEGVRNDNKF